jgi:hypothetical protein
MKINVGVIRGRRRPKKRWLDMIENDMRSVGICVRDTENRDEWRLRTKVIDPK